MKKLLKNQTGKNKEIIEKNETGKSKASKRKRKRSRGIRRVKEGCEEGRRGRERRS